MSDSIKSLLHLFLRDIRGGAPIITSVFVSIMALASVALVGDHVWLTRQRDLLKNAANSAVVAIGRSMNSSHSDEDLRLIGRRYILANLLGNLDPDKHVQVSNSLSMTTELDRGQGTVLVRAEADLGGAVFGRWIWGDLWTRVHAVAGVESLTAEVEVVLALDATGSMNNWLGSERVITRLEAVRAAALTLTELLLIDNPHETAVAVVPFNTTVNVGPSNDSWIVDSAPHKVWPVGYPPRQNCVEQRDMTLRVDGVDPTLRLPTEATFRQFFAPSTLDFDPAVWRMMLEDLLPGVTVNGENDWDRNDPSLTGRSPLRGCPPDPIVPLTTDHLTVSQAIETLRAVGGGGTMTHVAPLWARRLLSPEWRDTWGGSVHPVDWPGPDDNPDTVRKVLVLLSDGVNDAYDNPRTFPGIYGNWAGTTGYTSQYTGLGRAGSGRVVDGYIPDSPLTGFTGNRDEKQWLDQQFLNSCTLAKNDGIVVYTISAVPDGHSQQAAARSLLQSCATTVDHSYTHHSSAALLNEAFEEIANQIIIQTRRTL